MSSTAWTPLKKAILEAAVKRLARSGEASLRVDQVAREAGCSPALLYRHFVSREGLLEAAMVERLRREASSVTKPLLRAVRESQDNAEFLVLDEAISREVHGRHRARNRALLAEVLSASRTRPGLRKEFLQQQQEVQRELVDLIRAGQAKGLFRDDLSAEAIAEFVRAYTFGRALVDVDPASGDRLDDWVRVVAVFVAGLRPVREGASSRKKIPRVAATARGGKIASPSARARRGPGSR